ncbi:MAG: LysM peptidoglycan-binding domain-containing protein [Bacteroidia bacterium]
MIQSHRIFFICIVFCISVISLKAQGDGEGIHIQVGMGGTAYTGDLTEPDLPMFRTQPSVNLGLVIAGKGWIQPRIGVGFGSFIEQQDQNLIIPPAGIIPTPYVQSTFTHMDLQLQLVLWRKRTFSLSMGGGLGLLFFSPKNFEGDFLIDNPFTRLPEEEYPGFAPSFPLSVGLNIRLKSQMGLRLEYTYRPTGTDYLDNIGLLGNREGNDRLQSISVGFWVGLRPPKAPKEASPQPTQENIAPAVSRTTPPRSNKAEESQASSTSPAKTRELAEAQKLEEVKEKEAEAISARRYRYHRVEKKDTLEKIAKRYGVRISTLRRINFLVNNEIIPGSLLRIPDIEASESRQEGSL